MLRGRHRAWPLVLAVAGCARPAAAPTLTSAPPLAPSAEAIAESAPRDALADALCAGVDPAAPDRVRVRADDVVLGCADGDVNHCEGVMRYGVANCGDEPIDLRALLFTFPDGRGRLMIEPESSAQRIDPHASWAWRTTMYTEALLSLELDAADAQGARLHVRARSVRISNPARQAVLAACDACGGVWGVHGLSGVQACNCKARDAGRECTDGRACEGACKFNHWAISKPAQPFRCEGGRCGASFAIGRPVGQCSEWVMVRGCGTRLASGIGEEPDRTLPWGLDRSCVD